MHTYSGQTCLLQLSTGERAGLLTLREGRAAHKLQAQRLPGPSACHHLSHIHTATKTPLLPPCHRCQGLSD